MEFLMLQTSVDSIPLTTLADNQIRLEPLGIQHATALSELVKDGKLWELTITSAPEPNNALAYIEKALAAEDRLAFAVIETNHAGKNDANGKLIGTTSYHDILPNVKRLEIGYTFYGKSYWRSHVNTTCKLLLLTHAFDTLNYQTVGWRTDNLNQRSQTAIERLGAKKDGVIRGQALRRDGTIRNTVMYSMTIDEWRTGAKDRLLAKQQAYLSD